MFRKFGPKDPPVFPFVSSSSVVAIACVTGRLQLRTSVADDAWVSSEIQALQGLQQEASLVRSARREPSCLRKIQVWKNGGVEMAGWSQPKRNEEERRISPPWEEFPQMRGPFAAIVRSSG